MIIPQMSEAELLEEIRLDLPNVVSISDTKDTKVRRIIQKSVLFPIYLHSFVTSPRKNKWIILWEARNKKNIGDNSLITFLCYQETPHGRYVFMPTWSNGSLILIVYPPHFFSRFAERMSLDVTGVNLIRRYFEKNNSYTFETEEEYKKAIGNKDNEITFDNITGSAIYDDANLKLIISTDLSLEKLNSENNGAFPTNYSDIQRLYAEKEGYAGPQILKTYPQYTNTEESE